MSGTRVGLAAVLGAAALAACGLSVGGLDGDATDPFFPDASADALSWMTLDAAAADDSPFAPPPDASQPPFPGPDAGDARAPTPAPADAGQCDADLATDPAHCGRCDRDCAGGSCSAGACTPAAIVDGANPIRALGVSDAYLVWVDDEPTLYRQPLDGGTAEPIFSPSDGVSELFVAGDVIYYSTGDLHRVGIDGTGDAVLATGGVDACLQVSGTTAYVVNGSSPPLSIDSIDLASGTRTSLVPTGDLQQPWGVAVTATDVYWSGNQHGVPDGGIWRLPAGGGAATEVVPHLANPNCITVYGDALFWPNSDDGTIMTSAFDGSRLRTLANGQDLTDPPTTVAVDARFVYWQGGTRIYRLAR